MAGVVQADGFSQLADGEAAAEHGQGWPVAAGPAAA